MSLRRSTQISKTKSAALVVAVLLGGVALFQVALVLGVPWGGTAYGGEVALESGTLPAGYRLLSAVAAVALVFAAWVVTARAGISPAGPLPTRFLTRATWVIFAYLLVNTATNQASSSSTERWVFGPISMVAAVLCLIVALNADRDQAT